MQHVCHKVYGSGRKAAGKTRQMLFLTGSSALAPGDDGTRVPHAPPGRSCGPSNEANHGLVRVPVLHEPIGSILFGLRVDTGRVEVSGIVGARHSSEWS